MARLLSRGTTGSDVSELQAALNFHIRGPATPLKPDAIFGPLTDARVRDFQRRAKLKVDGLVGPNTIASLYQQLSGAVEARLTPKEQLVASRRSLAGDGLSVGDGPADPDVVRPQTRTATGQGFDTETKFVFNPLAKPSEGENPLQLTISKSFPWPIFLPEPLTLDIDAGVGSKFELDAKLKRPFKIIATDRFELKPYFFVGGGVEPDKFKDINVGIGARIGVKIFKDIGGTGSSVGLEADGGIKYKHDLEKDEGKAKGFFDTTVVFTAPFDFF
jgi:Putative peptidoglycan binding domain